MGRFRGKRPKIIKEPFSMSKLRSSLAQNLKVKGGGKK